MRLYKSQPSGTLAALRALRRNPTEAEKVLLRALKEAFPEREWRFQAPIGPFRVDFLCFAEQLVIEVDGDQHSEEADATRTRFIEREGYRVLRFRNNDVLGNTEGVIAKISEALLSLSRRERKEPRSGGRGRGAGRWRRTHHPHPPTPLRGAGPSLSHRERGFKRKAL